MHSTDRQREYAIALHRTLSAKLRSIAEGMPDDAADLLQLAYDLDTQAAKMAAPGQNVTAVPFAPPGHL